MPVYNNNNNNNNNNHIFPTTLFPKIAYVGLNALYNATEKQQQQKELIHIKCHTQAT